MLGLLEKFLEQQELTRFTSAKSLHFSKMQFEKIALLIFLIYKLVKKEPLLQLDIMQELKASIPEKE